MLSEVQPWKDEFRAFFQGDLRRSRDGLTALSLHRRGGIPVILVHGTASSSATWANMMNDLMAEPEIRRNYEFWLFTYNSGAPMLYSASLLREAIADTVASLGADRRDPALKRAVVIGHSQGGLLTKLTAVRSEEVFWNRISDVPLESLDMKPATRALIQSAIFVEPSPYVSRVVYIATPHRGSFLLNWGATSILRRLVRAPSTVVRATADLVSQNPESAALRRIDDVQGSLGQMHPASPFLEHLLPLEVVPPVEAHSIIAAKEFLGKERSSDGVVRYRSAQLDGVQSEVVVQSGHSCLDHPHVIEEVRRILLMHLGMAPRVNSRD
jgi:pimeloyl-ACP methyl ester carboxylesterase